MVVPGAVEGGGAEDDGPILKNPKTKWLHWQHTLYSICVHFVVLVAPCRSWTIDCKLSSVLEMNEDVLLFVCQFGVSKGVCDFSF